MTTTFKELMSRLSEDELMDYLNNSDKYTAEAITEAVDELKRRGKNFTKEELNEIRIKIQTSKEEEEEEEEDDFWNSNTKERNLVTDQNAPLLYSKGAIRGFSGVFSVIFGAVLLSSNITDRSKKLTVIGFGIIFTAITIVIVNYTPAPLYCVLILNTAGGLGLITTFWDKYIGKKTKYRRKPVWKPLIISTIIIIALLLAFLYG